MNKRRAFMNGGSTMVMDRALIIEHENHRARMNRIKPMIDTKPP